jgi:LemA protein
MSIRLRDTRIINRSGKQPSPRYWPDYNVDDGDLSATGSHRRSERTEEYSAVESLIVPGIIVLIVVIIGIYLWSTYNGLVKLNLHCDEAWSGISVQLKRRADLIPNLIESVKGYAAHEKTVFEDVARARAEALSARGPVETGVAENHMHSALKSILAIAEAYPQLQASQNFVQLQGELVDVEDKIQASRRLYNGGVSRMNARIKMFPNTLFVRGLGFTEREFFDVPDSAAIAEPPHVQF